MSFEVFTYLARSYFHQDFDLVADTPEGVVAEFRRREDPDTVELLRREVDLLLASQSAEEVVRDLWMVQGGASYDPQFHGVRYTQWLERMRAILHE
ncbi:contact-dependent growth inhibition system immunity protein [Verrucosispora sp. WMMD703]|uniref:contact-dependent growth inhibition system immunity protein n=1 Tax=Verrucosispora sp. WMMD703 TaxID=3403463 RepID=UPI003B962AF1